MTHTHESWVPSIVSSCKTGSNEVKQSLMRSNTYKGSFVIINLHNLENNSRNCTSEKGTWKKDPSQLCIYLQFNITWWILTLKLTSRQDLFSNLKCARFFLNCHFTKKLEYSWTNKNNWEQTNIYLSSENGPFNHFE